MSTHDDRRYWIEVHQEFRRLLATGKKPWDAKLLACETVLHKWRNAIAERRRRLERTDAK